MKKQDFLRLSMQYFADDVQETGQNEENQIGNPEAKEKEVKLDFEELAKTNKEFQSFLDKERTKSNQTAIENFQKKQKLLADAQATEDEKLKAMTEKERIAYEAKKKDEEIAQLKHQIAVTKLKEQVITLGTEKNIPNALLELINYDTLKAEQVEEILNGISSVFDKAVADAVAKNLSGAGTPKGTANKEAVTEKPLENVFSTKKWNRFNY